ncbi:asparagine synthase C-terminal domain-containing protein, partial [bacterium]|nr:asparagine synthase C-terminal domain-containing protein [bacterium]
YLSGGMDSSAIVQKMRELNVADIKTFTLGFNEPSDEFPDAELISKYFDTDHYTKSLTMEPMQLFPEVLWHAEEPKINLLQGFNMSQFVKPHVTVALGGLGGDEILAGYDIHKLLYPLSSVTNHIPVWLKRIGRFKSDLLYKLQTKFTSLKQDEYRRAFQTVLALGDIEKQYLILRNVWDMDDGNYSAIYQDSFLDQMAGNFQETRQKFTPLFDKVRHLNGLDQVLYTEFQTKMVNDYLLTDDRMSMSHGVEERVPFLDKDLVEFAFSIPLHLKIKGGKTKNIFRKSMEGYLPDSIIHKKKWGFSVNPYLQYKKDLKNVTERILTEEAVKKAGIFNYNYIRRILDAEAHPNMRWHYNLLWIMAGLMIWKDMFIDSDKFLKRDFNLESYYA